jgi:hypothetical protein
VATATTKKAIPFTIPPSFSNSPGFTELDPRVTLALCAAQAIQAGLTNGLLPGTIGSSAFDAKSDPNGLKKSRDFAQVPVAGDSERGIVDKKWF